MFHLQIDPAYAGISLQSVTLPKDTELILQHLKTEIYNPSWKLKPAPEPFEKSYTLLLRSLGSGAFFLFDHERILFMLEIGPMKKTNFGKYYDVLSNDYYIQVILSFGDATLEPTAIRALQACLDGILLHTEVSRIVFPVFYNRPEGLLRRIVKGAGFVLLEDPMQPGKPAVYAYSQNSVQPGEK